MEWFSFVERNAPASAQDMQKHSSFFLVPAQKLRSGVSALGRPRLLQLGAASSYFHLLRHTHTHTHSHTRLTHIHTNEKRTHAKLCRLCRDPQLPSVAATDVGPGHTEQRDSAGQNECLISLMDSGLSLYNLKNSLRPQSPREGSLWIADVSAGIRTRIVSQE